MQKKIISLLTILTLTFPFGGKDGLGAYLQAETLPDGYYNSAQGKTDAELKTALSLIIRGGQRYDYGSQGEDYHTQPKVDPFTGDTLWKKGDPRYGTWTAFVQTDLRSDGTVWDMYSNTKRYFPILGGSAAGMDIEHSFPKSWWGGQDSILAVTDLYLLNPADRVANNNKSNFPPGRLVDSTKVNNGIFFMGKDTTWKGNAFTVLDEYKGDFARAYFYVATAYEYYKWTAYPQYINKDSYQGFVPYLRDILLEWHRLDPVSKKEIDRINAISSIQHNRNPFIDYPELVEYIWGNKQGHAVDFTTLTLTSSTSYEVPISSANPEAFTPYDVSQREFTARWSDTGSESYSLDVYTLEKTGHNDTIINMPGFKSKIINANPHLQWCNADGSTSTFGNMDGSYATCMSTTSALKQLRIIDLAPVPAQTFLDVKCCVFKGDQTADLVIKNEKDEILYTQPLTLDEQVYTFAIPEGTTALSLWQKEIGKKSSGYHRISLQKVFLYTGDEKMVHTSITGYPLSVEGESYVVHVPEGTPNRLYYDVTPVGLRTSNSVMVELSHATSIPPVHEPATPSVRKVFKNNQIYIISPYSSTPLLLYSL